MNDTLKQLVAMSRTGRPGKRLRDPPRRGKHPGAQPRRHLPGSKPSGYQLPVDQRDGLVRLTERALSILDAGDLSDGEVKQRLLDARVDPETGRWPAPNSDVRPSTETVFHAICLSLEDVSYLSATPMQPQLTHSPAPRRFEARTPLSR